MASLRAKAPLPVGSSSWISSERENAAQMSSQDVEDFTFAACNDVEWLNEHMADIFSKNQFEVTEIFKTPGKLRGKTPRTARKRNPLEQRLPLTDIFAPTQSSVPSPLREPQAYRQASQFLVAEDKDHTVAQTAQRVDRLPTGDEGKEDGNSNESKPDDEAMEVDIQEVSKPIYEQTKSGLDKEREEPNSENIQKAASPLLQQKSRNSYRTSSKDQKRLVDDEAYASQSTLRNTQIDSVAGNYQSSTQQSYDSAYASQDTQVASFSQSKPAQGLADPRSGLIHIPTKAASDESHHLDADQPMDDAKSGSEGSSPVRPIIRKSSLNFASLPAREPLTTKKSFGARTSRTSHLDASKPNGPLRTSYHTKKGVSNAHLEHQDDFDVDMDVDDRPVLPREESDGETKLMKIHNKTSTQRLHDKINALGQSHASRPTKSIPSAISNTSQPIYPDIPQAEVEPSHPSRTAQQSKTSTKQTITDEFDEEDEDDWIPSKSLVAAPSGRPQLHKSFSTDVMEQIRNKDSIGGLEGLPVSPQHLSKPLPKSPRGSPAPSGMGKHGKSASVSDITIQPRPITASGVAHGKLVSVSNPDFSSRYDSQQQTSYTPAGTPASKIQGDGPLSASKAKLSSILKSARGIFASSAGVSAQAKMETLSPRTIRVREQNENASLNSLMASHAANQQPKNGLYPNIDNSLKDASRVTSAASGSPKKDEGRRTRSSSEREEKRKEKEAKELQKMTENLEKARDKEAQKALAHKMEKERVASQEKQYLLKREQEKAAKAIQVEQPTRKSPRKAKAKDDEESAPNVRRVDDVDTAMTDGQAVEDQQAKSREPRRPMKPIKEMAAKSKPAPVSIRVGTASQWELDHRKIGQIHPSNTTLAATLQDTLAPGPSKPATLQSKASNASMNTASGSNTLKSSVSSSSKPKALLAAAKKKEQDEKEAQRKADHKREIDRKRAAQHEEDRRQETQQTQQRKEIDRQQRERSAQPEEARKVAQKQAIEKRRLENAKKAEPHRNPTGPRPKPITTLVSSEKIPTNQATQRGELGAARPPSRMNAAPPRVIQEPLGRSINQPPVNTVKPPKRPHQTEAEEFPFRGEKTGQGYHQQDGKRRRTNEETEAADARPPMAPPIRQSNIRTKDAPVKSIFSHGYGSAQPTSSMQQGPSTIKTVMSGQNYPQQSKAAHPRDMAKFATAKIPFGDNSGNHTNNTIHKTPARPATATAKSSPRYQNGDSIELPEIATDSEDDDDDNDFAVPDWAANSPIITDQLIRQDSWNPEEVFGPIAPLHMEEIFRNKDRHHRFRSRTSSANWSGQDRLTQEEILRDTEAREKLRANGGWTYGL